MQRGEDSRMLQKQTTYFYPSIGLNQDQQYVSCSLKADQKLTFSYQSCTKKKKSRKEQQQQSLPSSRDGKERKQNILKFLPLDDGKIMKQYLQKLRENKIQSYINFKIPNPIRAKFSCFDQLIQRQLKYGFKVLSSRDQPRKKKIDVQEISSYNKKKSKIDLQMVKVDYILIKTTRKKIKEKKNQQSQSFHEETKKKYKKCKQSTGEKFLPQKTSRKKVKQSFSKKEIQQKVI